MAVWWPDSTITLGMQTMNSMHNKVNMRKKRRAWDRLQCYSPPVPDVHVDPSEPTDFFAWCRHHRVVLPPTHAVALCSESTCGAYPGIPLTIYRQRRFCGTEIVDMTAYEPTWGMPVHIALDRLLKIENALTVAGSICDACLTRTSFYVLLDHAEALRRTELHYSPTIFVWMQNDRRYMTYHARQAYQLRVMERWNLKHLSSSVIQRTLRRRNSILRSTRPTLARELQALNVEVHLHTDVCTLKAMMMDNMK